MPIRHLFKRVAKHVCCALLVAQCALAIAPPSVEARKVQPLDSLVSELIQKEQSFEVKSVDPHCNRNLIMVNGAEFTKSGIKDHVKFTEMVALPVLSEHSNLFVVGGPTKGTDTTDLIWALKEASKNNLPTTIFIVAHGNAQDRKHVIMLDADLTPTATVFQTISDHMQKPVSVFLVSCHGGAALGDVKKLPDGSDLVVLTTPEEAAEDSYTKYMFVKMVDEIQNNKDAPNQLDGKNLFISYVLSFNKDAYMKFNGKEYIEAVTKGTTLEKVIAASFGSPAYIRKGSPPIGLDAAKKFLKENDLSLTDIDTATDSIGGVLTREEAYRSIEAFKKTGGISNQAALIAWASLQEKMKSGQNLSLDGNNAPPPERVAVTGLVVKNFMAYAEKQGIIQ